MVGRLLADTGSLPQGKLEAVRRECERTGKPFEYAFLLDALTDEQDQGITIDTARCFFKSARRDYIIIDAPGHIEFLKNMISGAARAEAAVLVIDAKEGVRENSRRHGYILSMLGIRQVVVCVNKMDLVGYDEAHFARIESEYRAFLDGIGSVSPKQFIPVSAIAGENLAIRSSKMPWYQGPTLLETLDGLAKAPGKSDAPFRMPVQAVYKFTNAGDDRRIIAGRIEIRSRQGRGPGRVLAVEQDHHDQEHRGVQRPPADRDRRRVVDRIHAVRGDLRHPRRGDEPRRAAPAGHHAAARERHLAGAEAVHAGARLQAEAAHGGGDGAHPQDSKGHRRLGNRWTAGQGSRRAA